MNKRNDLYIGNKSRPHTCKICMRTKEDAVAEQLQSGKTCGHARCEFKTEIDLVSAILNTSNPEQLQSLTSESIETNKKTYDLLVSLRESVRGMKESFENEIAKDNAKIKNPSSGISQKNVIEEVSNEQLQSILDRIDISTRTMSKLIESKGNSMSKHSNLPSPENIDQVDEPESLKEIEERKLKDKKEWEEYLLYRKEFNLELKAGWAKVNEALQGMRDVVEEMKIEAAKNQEPEQECINHKRSKTYDALLNLKSVILNKIRNL